MQTITFRTDKQQSPYAYHRELYPITCNGHDEILYDKKNVYMCITGSLCCTAEIDRTLSINFEKIQS